MMTNDTFIVFDDTDFLWVEVFFKIVYTVKKLRRLPRMQLTIVESL